MLDPGLAFSAAAVVVAAIFGAVAGGRRGASSMSRRADDEVAKLIAAQSARIELLEHENERLRQKIAALEGQVKALREELDVEKRITARLSISREESAR